MNDAQRKLIARWIELQERQALALEAIADTLNKIRWG